MLDVERKAALAQIHFKEIELHKITFILECFDEKSSEESTSSGDNRIAPPNLKYNAASCATSELL